MRESGNPANRALAACVVKNPAKQRLHFVEYADTGIGLAINDATGQVYYYQIFAMPEK